MPKGVSCCFCFAFKREICVLAYVLTGTRLVKASENGIRGLRLQELVGRDSVRDGLAYLM